MILLVCFSLHILIASLGWREGDRLEKYSRSTWLELNRARVLEYSAREYRKLSYIYIFTIMFIHILHILAEPSQARDLNYIYIEIYVVLLF